ncbi:hypothetical protein [Cupriavidus pinatubonensis]|uniref:hypothetical protein n=1 Tax=Cupriavidus pinatubonensis TaxID=248026 RepID=UPI00112913AC|nr:hypothetical protein [Cupriavidus pinatubonensis]TPQ31823.1 hypothetical protein C2U69_27690 [Cupriavidus pinatubonensis]
MTSPLPRVGTVRTGNGRPQTHSDKSEQETEYKDRPFNGFRIAKTERARAVVADVINQIQNLETFYSFRQRARKPGDQQQFEQQIEAIVCDLIHRQITAPGGKLAVPFSKTILGNSDRYRAKVLGKTLPDVIERMAMPEMDFVCFERGYQNPFLEGGSRQTVMWAGARLRSRIEDYQLTLRDLGVGPGEEIIILKASKEDYFDTGKRIQYEDTLQTMAFREELQRINDGLERAKIDFLSPSWMNGQVEIDVSDRRLRRVFNNGSFEQGGRLFGGFWQALPRGLRKHGILIDDTDIVTLDYGQMAPLILYGRAGIKPHFDDAYAVPGLEPYRDGVKKLMNAMIQSYRPLVRRPQGTKTLLPKNLRLEQMLELITDFHKPIASFFGVGKGLNVFYQESQILVSVLTRLTEHGITALPIHDAVIVSEDRQEKAKAVMLAVFKEVTGIDGRVELDE